MTPTDDKRIEEIRARYAVTRGAHAADIAFLLGKISEYEARDENAVRLDELENILRQYDERINRPMSTALGCLHLLVAWLVDRIAALRYAAPPPQVREAESVERQLESANKKLTRMECGHLFAEMKPGFVNFSEIDVVDEATSYPAKCLACERERTAREEGVKAGLKAAAEKRCRFCDDGVVIVSGEHVNSSGNGIPCGAQDILALPVTEIARRKD